MSGQRQVVRADVVFLAAEYIGRLTRNYFAGPREGESATDVTRREARLVARIETVAGELAEFADRTDRDGEPMTDAGREYIAERIVSSWEPEVAKDAGKARPWLLAAVLSVAAAAAGAVLLLAPGESEWECPGRMIDDVCWTSGVDR